jgi:D-alanyl-D-alanine carboxypeptidase (penicillin-binding protein 5/6)
MDHRCFGRVLFWVLAFSLLTNILSPSASFTQTIKARAAVVMDAISGRVLLSKNPDILLPPASTTKLLTAMITMEQANLWDSVAISKNASRAPQYKMGLKAGEKVSIELLLYAALLKSSNDAAVALAEAVGGSEECFVQLMNEKVVSLGAYNTRFVNPHGLPGPNQYTTAYDLAQIMIHAMGYPKIREIIGTPVASFSTEKGKPLFLTNTDKLLWSDEDLVGGKTGFTQTAGHCFVCVAERENKTIVVSILGSPNRKTLWKETQALIDKGFQLLLTNTSYRTTVR